MSPSKRRRDKVPKRNTITRRLIAEINAMKKELFDALNEIDVYREHMKIVMSLTKKYTLDTPDEESKLDYGNVIMTLADCTEMYLARLEVATENAWKCYFQKETAA